MLKDIHSSFKPAQPYRHNREEKSLIGHNLCSFWLQLKRHEMVHTDPRGSWRQPRSSCVPPPTYHPQRPESHEESPSYSWYKNAYFRSFLKTDSPIGCIVTLHWLHDRAFGTLSLRENDLSSIFVRYFIHIRSGVRCEKYYGSSMFVLERPLSSACIGFH